MARMLHDCAVPGCGRKTRYKLYCPTHHRRARKGLPVDVVIEPRQPKTVCRICGFPAKGRGLCNMHLARFYAHGDPLWLNSEHRRYCQVPGCLRALHARGWCEMHYERWFKNGSPFAVVYMRKASKTMRTGDGWTDAQDIYLWRTMGDLTPAQQAAELGKTAHEVTRRRAQLKGASKPARVAYPGQWQNRRDGKRARSAA